MAVRWDFEGRVRFLSAEEGGRQTPARMGYFPQLRYPDFNDPGDWIARPVEAFHLDGKPYSEGETLEQDLTMRFFFVSRDLADRVHRTRLVVGLRFSLAEGKRTVATGNVTRTNFD